MPFVSRPYDDRFSDLVFHELDPCVGYARESVNVTPPAASAPVLIGTVVFRAKSLDPSAAYAVLTSAASIVATNEFAVIYGDQYSFNPSFVPNAVNAGEFNAVGFVRGPLQIKEYFVKQRHSGLNATQFETLRQALKAQGIIMEKTL